MGAEQVHALRGVDVESAKANTSHHGSFGIGQVHADDLIGCLDSQARKILAGRPL